MAEDGERGAIAAGEDVLGGHVFGKTNQAGAVKGSGTARPVDASVTGGGLGSLAAGVIEDVQDLVRSEIELAKTELKEEVTTAAGGATAIAAGAVAGSVGFVFLMLALTELLSRRLPRWMAAGVVGLALTGAAAALGAGGKTKLSAVNLIPKQTLRSLRENTALFRRNP